MCFGYSTSQGNPAMTSTASAPPTPTEQAPRPPAFGVCESVPMISSPGKAYCSSTTWWMMPAPGPQKPKPYLAAADLSGPPQRLPQRAPATVGVPPHRAVDRGHHSRCRFDTRHCRAFLASRWGQHPPPRPPLYQMSAIDLDANYQVEPSPSPPA